MSKLQITKSNSQNGENFQMEPSKLHDQSLVSETNDFVQLSMDCDIQPDTVKDNDEVEYSIDRLDSTHLFLEEEEYDGNSTKRGVCCNYINLTAGGGVVGIPKAVVLCGYIPGMAFLIVYGILACLNSKYLIDSGREFQTSTYESTVRKAFGRKVNYISVFAIFLLNFGASIVCLQVVGHGCAEILHTAGVTYSGLSDSIDLDSLALLVMSATFVLPLSLTKHVNNLVYSSYFSNMAIVVFVLVMIIQGRRIRGEIENGGTVIEATPIFGKSFRDQVVGTNTILFNYCTGLSLSFGAYKSLTPCQRNPTDWWSISVITMMFCSCLYISLGLPAAILFGTTVPDDIVQVYPPGDIAGSCAVFLIIISVVLTTPLNNFITRDVVNRVINIDLLKLPEDGGIFRHFCLTLGCWAAVTLIAMFYKDVLYVIALNGSLCGTVIGFIFPPAVHIASRMKLRNKKTHKGVVSPSKSETNDDSWIECLRFYFFPCLSLLGGVFCLIFGTIYIIWDMAT